MHPTGLHVVRHHVDAPGPPVVLVHGAPDRSKNFAHVVHQLSDLPVTAYDRRGYGKSLAAGEHGGGFHTHAADLIALLNDTPSIVVGQSAGGAIAMLAATIRPDLFLALGVWEPPMVPWMWWVGPDAWERTIESVMCPDTILLGEQFNRRILGDDRWEELAERTQDLLRAEGEAFRADMTSQIEPYFDLADLTVPMVVGCGTLAFDEAHRTAPHRLAERLGAELLVVEGADHFSHLSNPGAWVQLVRATVALAGCRTAGGGR